eukprot:5799983-Pleurochrysis_carterae.AAC.2
MEQAAKSFTPTMVLDQLRCSGVVEAVRVMQEAFPTRIPFEDIHGRYAKLMGEEVVRECGDDPAAFCEAIAIACEVSNRDYALGLTRLFLKVGAAPPLSHPLAPSRSLSLALALSFSCLLSLA